MDVMLNMALQKLIDNVEARILLNTDNAITICTDTEMEKTYPPWIYSEIICIQLVRKKPLLVYRNYSGIKSEYSSVTESVKNMAFVLPRL